MMLSPASMKTRRQRGARPAVEPPVPVPDQTPEEIRRTAKQLARAGAGDAAIALLTEGVERFPSYAPLCRELGDQLHALGESDEAIAAYRQGLRIEPESLSLLTNLGATLQDLGETDEAIAIKRRTVALHSDSFAARYNLAVTLREAGDVGAAIKAYQETLRLNPWHVRAWNNMGIACMEELRIDDAEHCFRRARQLQPDADETAFNRALVRLLTGNLSSGWQDYEARLPAAERNAVCAGRMFVRSEQGVGDEIMFSTCLPDLIRGSSDCVVECDRRLRPLLERSVAGARFIDTQENGSNLNAAAGRTLISMGSLPRLFRNDWSDFPCATRHLVADDDCSASWRARLGALGPGLRIGLSWRGGHERVVRKRKSIPTRFWREICEHGPAQFINLQYDSEPTEHESFRAMTGGRFHTFEELDRRDAIDESAALISSLDLVITVSNATAHLSGAIGTPTWIVLPWMSDWRWFLDRDDSPWYRSVRLFRQTRETGWSSTLSGIGDALSRGIVMGGRG